MDLQEVGCGYMDWTVINPYLILISYNKPTNIIILHSVHPHLFTTEPVYVMP